MFIKVRDWSCKSSVNRTYLFEAPRRALYRRHICDGEVCTCTVTNTFRVPQNYLLIYLSNSEGIMLKTLCCSSMNITALLAISVLPQKFHLPSSDSVSMIDREEKYTTLFYVLCFVIYGSPIVWKCMSDNLSQITYLKEDKIEM